MGGALLFDNNYVEDKIEGMVTHFEDDAFVVRRVTHNFEAELIAMPLLSGNEPYLAQFVC